MPVDLHLLDPVSMPCWLSECNSLLLIMSRWIIKLHITCDILRLLFLSGAPANPAHGAPLVNTVAFSVMQTQGKERIQGERAFGRSYERFYRTSSIVVFAFVSQKGMDLSDVKRT